MTNPVRSSNPAGLAGFGLPNLGGIELLTESYANSITAKAGGGKTGATALSNTINEVDTVGTAADSCLLPAAFPGRIVSVINNGANALQLFGQGTDTINGVATGTGISQAAGKTAAYVCAKQGAWFQILSA